MALFSKIDLQENSWLDQIFLDRNKAYGAYTLRQGYAKSAVYGLLLATAGFVFCICLPLIINSIGGLIPKEKVIQDINILKPPPPVDATKPPPPPPKTPPPPPVKTTIKFTPPVIKKDEEVKKEDIPPPVEETKKVDIGEKTVKGDDNAKVEIPEEPKKAEEVGEDPNKIFLSVEEKAEYPGGDEALLRDVNNNIKYPPQAKENNIQGRVFVNFVVEKDGSVSNITVTRGKELGGGLAEAAIAAVRKLKRFKPGRQNGNSVRMYYNLPVTFQLQGAEDN